MEYKLPEAWFQCTRKEEIGTGAYGTVYRIEDPDHNVSAVKVLHIPSTEEEVQTIKNEMKDPGLVRKYFTNLIDDFMREIQIMESLKDTTNVVKLKSHYLESNAVDEQWTIYIQMEALTSLTRYCSTHAMTKEEVVQMGIDVLQAIRDCNKKDIIHRDIKPDNIMVTEDGTFKLGDFGIARHVEQTDRNLTIRGTFSFMAPEVFHSENYGKTVDLYSLGLVMYRLLNKNRDPFVSTTKKLIYFRDKEEALKQRMEGQEIPPPVNASEELAEIILRACAYNVEDRYQCAEDMLRDLRDLQLGLYIKGRSYGDRSTVRRVRLAVRKIRYELFTVLFFLLCLIGLAVFTGMYKQKIDVKIWEPDQIELEEDTEAEILDEVEVYDAIVWDSMQEDDSDSFLNNFSNYSEEEYRQIYQGYYLLDYSKEYLGDHYDKYIGDYQERSKAYYHIIGHHQDIYYVEAVRYYIASDSYKDSRKAGETEDYYAGNLLQSSLYYWVNYEDSSYPDVDILTVRRDTEKWDDKDPNRNGNDETYINDIIVPYVSIPSVKADQVRHRSYNELGNYNYLYLDPEFIYPNYFRVSVLDHYISSDGNKISFVLSVKNGMDEDVLLRTVNIDIGEDEPWADQYPGEKENGLLDIKVERNSSCCYVLTYQIHKRKGTDPEPIDDYYVSGCRWETDLKGVKNNEK